VQASVDEDLPLSDITCQVRNGVRNVIVGHGKDRNLGDGPISALHATSTLVDGGQVRVHVTGETAAAGHFFSGGRDLTEGITVGREISEDDQDVLLELVGVVLGGCKGQAGCDNTLDAVDWSATF
jgi:hypothetical protein